MMARHPPQRAGTPGSNPTPGTRKTTKEKKQPFLYSEGRGGGVLCLTRTKKKRVKEEVEEGYRLKMKLLLCGVPVALAGLGLDGG